jgi:hypothetical protein
MIATATATANDDMPSAPLTRDEAFARFCAVVARVPDLDLRDALRHAAIDYTGAATRETVTMCFDSIRSGVSAR